MTEAQHKFIKRAILLTMTIAIYIVLTSTIIDYRQEKKVSDLLYDSVKNWAVKPAPADPVKLLVDREKALVTEVDDALSAKLSGRILLQAEANGEAWYIFPNDKKKYYLGRPADAFRVMAALGLGIKSDELGRYLKAKFPIRLAGQILLNIEKSGEAYYVYPLDLKGYALGQPENALNAMKMLGLGISNIDLRKIAVGEIE